MMRCRWNCRAGGAANSDNPTCRGSQTPRAHLGVVLLRVRVVAREALVVVRDVQAAVHCSLQGTKDTVASRRRPDADVKDGSERPPSLLDLGHPVLALLVVLRLHHLASHRRLALVEVAHAELVQEAPCNKQAGRVARGVVLQANLDAVAGQLGRIRGREYLVAVNLAVDNLGDHVVVGQADDQAVAGALVLVLVVHNEALAGAVVRLAGAAASKLNLCGRHTRA